MRINGALRPHHGAHAIGSSIGVIKYRDKQCESDCSNVTVECISGHSKNNKQYYECNTKNNNNSDHSQASQNQSIHNNNNHNSIEVTARCNVSSSSVNEFRPYIASQHQKQHNKQTGQKSLNNAVAYRKETRPPDDILTAQDVNSSIHCSKSNSNHGENSINVLNATSCCYNSGSISNSKHSTAMAGCVVEEEAFNDAASSRNQVVLMDNQNTVWHMDEIVRHAAATVDRAMASLVMARDVGVAVKLVRVQQSLKAATTAMAAGLMAATTLAATSTSAIEKLFARHQRQHTSGGASGGGGAAASRKLCFSSTLLLMGFFCSLLLLPSRVRCDDSDNFFAVNTFSMKPGLETTPPEFDYASRGKKKFGDKCENTLECGFPGSICDPKKKSCQCTEDLPVTNHIDKCGKEAAVNESCFFNEQCEVKYFQTECRDGRCVCRFEMTAIWGKDGSVECSGRQEKRGPETYIDPAMIGVLVGMALMFIIICVVLRLFSQARWRENRTIFNTPNPRLMNVSLLRDSKLLHGQERRGSRMSVRAPSRQPSMASLRPHSPNPSLGKTGSRSGSHGSGSNVSAGSVRSTRSNSVAPGNVGNGHGHHERKVSSHHHHHHQQQHHHQPHHSHQSHQPHQQPQEQPLLTNITSNPAENVTVEIIVPEK